jgi:hypothetical protein
MAIRGQLLTLPPGVWRSNKMRWTLRRRDVSTRVESVRHGVAHAEPRKRSGYHNSDRGHHDRAARRSIGKLLLLTQTMFQFFNQLRKPRRSRRIGGPYRESAALLQFPFKLSSVRLLIHDGIPSPLQDEPLDYGDRVPSRDISEATPEIRPESTSTALAIRPRSLFADLPGFLHRFERSSSMPQPWPIVLGDILAQSCVLKVHSIRQCGACIPRWYFPAWMQFSYEPPGQHISSTNLKRGPRLRNRKQAPQA